MTTKQEPRCEQLVDDRLKDRLDDLLARTPESQYGEELPQPLSIDRSVVVVHTYKVCLSFGGPADFFELDWDGESWSGGRYIYQDWGDGATRKINHEEAEELAEAFGIYPGTGPNLVR